MVQKYQIWKHGAHAQFEEAGLVKAVRKDREVSLPLVFQCPIIDEGALEALKFDVSALIVVRIWHLKRIEGIRSYSWVQKYLIVTLKVLKFN